MNVTTELLEIVQQAHSLPRILDAATRVIRERFSAGNCSAFLLDEHGNLVLRASDASAPRGAVEAGVEEIATIAQRVRAAQRVTTVTGREMSLLAAPILRRDNLIGVLVVQHGGRREFSVRDQDDLATICGQLVGVVENARIVDALEREGSPPPRVAAPPLVQPNEGRERTLRGIAAAPGVAIGKAVFRVVQALEVAIGPELRAPPEAERARASAAIEKTRNDVLRVQSAAARELDEDHALIFASHLLLLHDPILLKNIDQRIEQGASAALAIDSALHELESKLGLVADEYIQERVDDVDDLRSRLLGHVLDADSRARFGGRIVLTNRIPPSLVVEMKTEGALALVTEKGSATSHGVLLARAMGIPAVTGVIDMLESTRPGDQLIVDGTHGVVILRPTADTLSRYEEQRVRIEGLRTEHAKFRDVLARTADGVRVTLLANVAVASDLRDAQENGAEGVGLYRTEFPFILRDGFPTLREQAKIYRKAYEFFPEGPIHFRILDLGGDKFALGGRVNGSRHAFHGYRSIRVLFDHPNVLRDQVKALALAAGKRPLSILIPMVTSMEELRRVKAVITQALADMDGAEAQRTPKIGVMIEVPAAVELAADIAREVDFLSIGTNDLMQYTLVVDREDSRMAHLSDPYHPAILRMISRVVAGAHASGKPVGVCGEVASRPDFALALLALGVDSLSVVPRVIPELKQALARARLEPLRHAMPRVLTLSDASSVVSALRSVRFAP
jgi:phosphotransferase system enzyme I (PtsP)